MYANECTLAGCARQGRELPYPLVGMGSRQASAGSEDRVWLLRAMGLAGGGGSPVRVHVRHEGSSMGLWVSWQPRPGTCLSLEWVPVGPFGTR